MRLPVNGTAYDIEPDIRSITGAAGAIANAVSSATGKRIRELPITLDKILAADADH